MMQKRKEYLRKLMKKRDLDIILVFSDLNNYSYDTALNGMKPGLFHYYYITLMGEGFLEIDYLVEELKSQTSLKIIPFKEDMPENSLAKLIKGLNVGIIGNAPFWHLKYIQNSICDLNKEAKNILLIKDDFEIDKIRSSAKEINNILKKFNLSKFIGKTEKEIGNFLSQSIMKNSEGLAFPVCVTSMKDIKKTTASFPSKRKISEKDIIIIDAGVVKEGFYSDCTRMYFLNYKDAEDNYVKLVNAHKRVISKIKPGLYLKEIAKLYKEELKREKLPEETLEIEDLGHSIGFYVHEHPMFYSSEQENIKLEENMIITLEPEIKFSEYRLRIEDMILVKEKSEILTS